jgi:hypothetical protein
MTIRKLGLAGAALMLLAGCQTRYLPVDDAGHHTAVAAPGAAAPVSPDALPAAPMPLAALSDTCGAFGLQYLVGKPKAEIPVPVNPGKRQVTCTSCARAPGDDPARTTILFDQGSGLVTQVICK